MNTIDIARRTLGVNFNDNNEAEVLLWAPLATKVDIMLQVPKTRLPLTKLDFGYWRLTSGKITSGTKYKFLLNGEKQLPDPASLSQSDGVHGASEALDIKPFDWTDNNWKNIPLQQYILYELHTGTFTPQGTFFGIEDKLDYLKELGINAIEIMPVSQFPGSRNWGYDGVYPFAVQDSYGGANGLKHLVNMCHEKGLAVILDVVYNHLGPEGNYLGEFGPYFTNKYNTPWGNAINFDDEWCDGVRRYFIENALMWFRDFHIDALRMDAVHAVKDFSPTHILREIKQYVDKLMEQGGRTHYLIVELDLNDTRFVNPLQKQGYGMDAQWVDEFHHALRVTAGEPRSGYYSDFEPITHLAKAYQDAYVFDGIYSSHRKKVFGIKAEDNPGQQFIVFSQNHDQVGNRMMGERTSTLVSFEMQKLMAGAVFASPYLPLLWMGEEYGETNPFLYFVSHTDKDLAEAVRKGRKEEFAAFHIEGEAPNPGNERTFEQSKLQWQLLQAEPNKTVLNYYKTLIAIRKQLPALCQLNRKQLNVSSSAENKTLLLHRWRNEQHVVCFMNFSKDQQTIIVPDNSKHWQKVLSSSDRKWGGSDAQPDVLTGETTTTLKPESFSIYINSNV